MKNFEFVKADESYQVMSPATTCVPAMTTERLFPEDPLDRIRLTSGSTQEKNELLKRLGTKTIFQIAALLENPKNIKLLCDLLNNNDDDLVELLLSRPLVMELVLEAQTEFLTDVLTREVKIE